MHYLSELIGIFTKLSCASRVLNCHAVMIKNQAKGADAMRTKTLLSNGVKNMLLTFWRMLICAFKSDISCPDGAATFQILP